MSHVPMTGEKTCRRCGETKGVREFRRFKRYGQDDREYRRSWCRDCDMAYAKEWRRRNPGYHAAWSRRYRAL